MEKIKQSVTKVVDVAEDIIEAAETGVKTVEKKVDAAVAPTRNSFLQRFPILFSLLVTFGVATTFLGFEQLVARTPFLYDRPAFMLAIGVGVLVITGTLYKKL
jgi:uncharacterized integral membrane protein